MKDVKQHNPKFALVAVISSVIIVSILILIKLYAYLESGSTAVLASLIDSSVDAIVSLMMFLAVSYSLKPADSEHRYGHGNVEALAALFQAVLLIIAAIYLVTEAINNIQQQSKLDEHIFAGSIITISIILTMVLVGIQTWSIKHSGSLAVEADRAHYSGDIWMNIGVIAALAIDYYNGPYWVDPVFAIIIAAILSYGAFNIGKNAINMILDRELPDEDRGKLLDIIKANDKVLDFHDLRTRKSGMDIFIAFDIEADSTISLKQAHDITVELEIEILKLYPQAQIMIHVDPVGMKEDLSRHSKVKL